MSDNATRLSARTLGIGTRFAIGGALVASLTGCDADAPSHDDTIGQLIWSAGTNIGGVPMSDPAITTWAPGRLDLFYLSSGGTLLHRWFQNSWSSEEDLGGTLTSAPTAVSWQSGRIDVFASGTAGDGTPNVLMHRWFTGQWQPWESLGGTLTSAPTVASWGPNRLDVFYANAAHALGHIWLDSVAGWEPHEQLESATFVGAPAAVSWSVGRIDVVARGTASGSPLVHKWFDSGAWHGWETLGGATSSNPTIASWGQGRLDVFYRGASAQLLTQWFDSAGWHAESSLGGTYKGSPAATSWGGQRIDVVIADPSAGIVQRTWLPQGSADVLTQHNDNYRSGAALFETALTPATVSSGLFGELYSLPVSGKVYAQPLYAQNVVDGSGQRRNLLYVATLDNNIYAFAADENPPALVWTRTLEPPTPNDGNPNFGATHTPGVGTLATPAISRTLNLLYVVASTGIGAQKEFRLHALDLGTGQETRTPVAVGGSVGHRSQAQGSTVQTFDPTFQLNRPGLLLADNLVYVAFGGSVDRLPYHGWVFAHAMDTLAQVRTYCTTANRNRSGGGIWQSGNGLAADEHGNIVFLTGNGEPASPAPNPPPAILAPDAQEGSFVKLARGSLAVLGQYWPHDSSDEFLLAEQNDMDLGSGGTLLVPGQDVILGGGKPGKMFVLDRALQQRQASIQAFVNVWDTDPKDGPPYLKSMDIAPNIHGTPVYWETSDPRRSYVYAWGEKDRLKGFPLDRQTLTIDPANILRSSVVSQINSMPGGMISLSANGNTAHTGIVWAVVEDPVDSCTVPADEPAACGSDDSTCNAICYTVPGYFYAFDAETLGQPLYRARIDRYSKFTPPTIANGRVFLATSNNEVKVYGLR